MADNTLPRKDLASGDSRTAKVLAGWCPHSSSSSFLNVHWCFAMGVESPGTGLTDSCELLCGLLGLNSGPLEVPSELLTIEPVSSPKPILFCTHSGIGATGQEKCESRGLVSSAP